MWLFIIYSLGLFNGSKIQVICRKKKKKVEILPSCIKTDVKPAFKNIYYQSDTLGCYIPPTDLSQYAAVFTKKTSLFLVYSPCPVTLPGMADMS